LQDAVVDKIKDEMQRLGLTRRELAKRLNDVTDKPITEQALGLWFARGRVPESRIADLEQVFQTSIQTDSYASGKSSSQFEIVKRVAGDKRMVEAERQTRINLGVELSPQAQMLAEWLDKIKDPMLKLECFHGCTALLMQALRQPTPTAAPAAPHQP
jgi:hypothetical protein